MFREFSIVQWIMNLWKIFAYGLCYIVLFFQDYGLGRHQLTFLFRLYFCSSKDYFFKFVWTFFQKKLNYLQTKKSFQKKLEIFFFKQQSKIRFWQFEKILFSKNDKLLFVLIEVLFVIFSLLLSHTHVKKNIFRLTSCGFDF
jgi:hypothetical protein